MGEAVKLVKAGRPDTAFMFFGVEEGAVAYTCSVPEAMVAKGFTASDWANQVKDCLGGRGGGKDLVAQGTGADETKVRGCQGGSGMNPQPSLEHGEAKDLQLQLSPSSDLNAAMVAGARSAQAGHGVCQHEAELKTASFLPLLLKMLTINRMSEKQCKARSVCRPRALVNQLPKVESNAQETWYDQGCLLNFNRTSRPEKIR